MARRVRKTYKQQQKELEAPEVIEEQLWSLSDWMERNWKPVVGSMATVVLIWGGLGIYNVTSDSAADDAAAMTASTFAAAWQPVYTPPADLQGEDPNKPLGPSFGTDKERAEAIVKSAASRQGDAPGGAIINVVVGAAKAELGDHTAQLAAIDAALASAPDQALELSLRRQRATALSALKRLKEEAAEWQKVATLTKTGFGKALAQIRIGDLHNPNAAAVSADAAKARDAYKTAIKATESDGAAPKDGPLAMLHAEASNKLARL